MGRLEDDRTVDLVVNDVVAATLLMFLLVLVGAGLGILLGL